MQSPTQASILQLACPIAKHTNRPVMATMRTTITSPIHGMSSCLTCCNKYYELKTC